MENMQKQSEERGVETSHTLIPLFTDRSMFFIESCSCGHSILGWPLKADATVNQYNDDQANPVVVRLYQLTDQQLFKQLPFIDLYNDLQLLAANLVSKQVLPIVLPSSEQKLTLNINKNTQYI